MPHQPRAGDGAPLLVEVTRGDMVESRHRGHAVIVDAAGRVQAGWGDVGLPVYPRSAIKPIQALALVETGAADAFGLGDEELALACASHSGAPEHTGRVARWLARIGCTPADLECGAHAPFDAAAAEALAQAGGAPSTLHNNCSGKHAGFLTTARHLGEPLRGYIDSAHPVQRRWLGILEEMTGQRLAGAPRGPDGCSIPTVAVPLAALAHAMARMAQPASLPEARAEAAHRVRRAWGGHPLLVAGRDRFDTLVMAATRGAMLVKGGAEGVHCACLPGLGLGLAVKIEDGAGRAADLATAALLRHVGALDAAAEAALADVLRPPVRTRRGRPAGEIRPHPGFPG